MPKPEHMLLRLVAVAVLAALVSACGADLNPTGYLPKLDSLTKNSLAFGEASRPSIDSPRPVTAIDLITADGQCASTGPAPAAAAPAAQSPDADAASAPALLPGGIALEMTECDVVRRAGAPDRFEFATADSGERGVTLTYINGPRPGIYHFVGGRLKSIERAPEPPAPAKPVKAKKPAPKKPPPAPT